MEQQQDVQRKPSKWRKTVIGMAVWGSAFAAGYLGYSFSQDQRFAWAEEKREEVRAGLAHAEDLAAAFRNVGKVMEPSVIKIDVRKKSVVATNQRNFDEDQLRRFFPDLDGDGEPDLPEGFRFRGPGNPFDEDGGFDSAGTGSGVIMEFTDGKGYILTNNHVAGGADEITVTLHDGREVKNGKLIGADPKTDLAVVEIKADRLSPAVWGDSDKLRKGDWVMAFGSPFGYVGSMTHGIVSALNRQAGILANVGGYENFIQVDAPINPGNSGGPLVNLRGEVVGINTAIASRSGGFQGIGFSVPSSQAKVIYGQLKDKGKVVRGWLGIGIRDVAKFPDLAKSFGYTQTDGVLVEQVMRDAPALKVLKRGDIVVELNGKPVKNVHELRGRVANLPPGADVDMKVFREGKQEQVSLKLGEQPEDLLASRAPNGGEERRGPGAAEKPTAAGALGVQVQTLTEEMARRQNLDVQGGAVITRVDRNSAAARQGLRVGDVILEVNETEIKTANDLTAALEKAEMDKGVRLYVASREGSRYVFIAPKDKGGE
jgi:serine protease Do